MRKGNKKQSKKKQNHSKANKFHQKSIDAVKKFSSYINRHRCSSFYLEFNNSTDLDATVSISCDNEAEYFVVISSEISLPESKLSTNQYKMTYYFDSLEIEIGNHTLIILCD
ncbi:hypothetical protein [Bacillus sp. OTU530]|uniref:hypothetical protein n=1 Tax=Bacillus sp. OTU530 TaxID=3043862 RepID=UPI00313F1985